MIEHSQIHQPSVILIEDKSSGTQLIQELVQDGMYLVKGIKPSTDKKMRMNAQTGVIENGFVHVPDRAPWLADYLHELTSFPFGKYDDQVDSTSQALEWILKNGMEPALLAYIRQECGRLGLARQ